MSDNKLTLGFIGIGLMGKPMTLRLLDAALVSTYGIAALKNSRMLPMRALKLVHLLPN